MAVFKFPPGSNIDDIFNVIKAMSLLPAETDAAIVEAIRVLAEGSLASDRQLLNLITALIERVNKLEAIEAERYKLWHSLVERQQELAKVATEAVDRLDALAKKYFESKRKDIH